MNRIYIAGLFLFSLVTISGCNIINPDEEAPSYIEVDKFTFDPQPGMQELGPSTSIKVKDVWVYVDDVFQGAYELPARFPVLKTGAHSLILSPGILLNGIAATRSPYPFYKGSFHDVNLSENGTVKITPVTSYYENAKCNYCESFEGSGFSLAKTAQSDTVMEQLMTGDPAVFEGTGSGVVHLDAAHDFFEVASTTAVPLPGSGAPVYLEFDYNINQSMTTGLFANYANGTSVQIPVVTLNPTNGWNKIYIQLGYTVSAYGAATGFKVYFGAIKQADLANPVFYLDNIKIVSF
jgi:hypothetical protein